MLGWTFPIGGALDKGEPQRVGVIIGGNTVVSQATIVYLRWLLVRSLQFAGLRVRCHYQFTLKKVMKIVKMMIVEDNEDVEDGGDEDEDKDNWWQKLCSDKSYVVIKVIKGL